MISKSFIKSSFIYTLIGSLPLASSILLLPFYGNTHLLSTSDYGLLAIYIMLSELARILFTFSADSFLGMNFIHNNSSKDKIEKFIGSTTVFLLVYGFGIAIFFSFIGDFIFSYAFPGKDIQYFPYGLLTALTGLFNGVFKAYSTLMIYRERPAPFFWSNILHFALVISISVSGLYIFPQSLNGPIWGRFLSASVTFLWSIVYFIKESHFKYDKSVISRLISFSAPLYLYSLLYWIVINIDRYFILGLMTEKDVAIFDFAIKMTLVIEFLQNGLSSAINPKVFQIWKKEGDIPRNTVDINKYFHVFALINIFCLPIFYISIPLLVPLIVNNKELYTSFNLLPVLFAGMITRVWYYYLIAPIFYFKRTRILPIVFAIAALCQIIGTYSLITFFKIEGAVWANFITKVIQVLLLYYFVRKFYELKVNVKKFIVFPLTYILLLLSIEVFFKSYNIYLINAIHLVIIATMGHIFFRKEINLSQLTKLLKPNV